MSPVQSELHDNIQRLRKELAANEQRLIKISQSLEQTKKEKLTVRRKFSHHKHILTVSHTKSRKLLEKAVEVRRQLQEKQQELHYLQLLQEQKEENEELKAIIERKVAEVRQLREILQVVEKELQNAKDKNRELREQLQQTATELVDKSARLQELERVRVELRADLEYQRRWIDQLLIQSAASTSRETYNGEIKVYLL